MKEDVHIPVGFPADAGEILTGLARSAIATRLRLLTADLPIDKEDWLASPGASFVTLRIDDDLRGCIGSLMAHRPLRDDVWDNAQAAAFRDPRFSPLSTHEFADVRLEVSVLSAPEPLPFTSKDDALAQLRPGVDGIILSARGRRATFLPQVWEELPLPRVFLAHLLNKAGLPIDFWDDSVRLERYTVTAFDEQVD